MIPTCLLLVMTVLSDYSNAIHTRQASANILGLLIVMIIKIMIVLSLRIGHVKYNCFSTSASLDSHPVSMMEWRALVFVVPRLAGLRLWRPNLVDYLIEVTEVPGFCPSTISEGEKEFGQASLNPKPIYLLYAGDKLGPGKPT
jgi:hypothetical protein